MPFFYCVPAIFMVNLIVAHSRLEDLFTLDSSDLSLDAFSDDASSFWSADENTSGFISLASNDLDQDPSFMSDINSLSSSNNLFASNSPDSTALFSCESEGSQLDGFLQARDGSCPPQENFNLDLQLFQDPEGYLRDNINVPPKGQMNQPGQEGKQDENRYMDFLTTNFKEDEEKCPTATYGSSNIPVCRNPFTGRMEYEPSSFAVTLYNALPYTSDCLRYSMLFCCALLTSREFTPEEAIVPSRFNPGQLQFLSHLGEVAYDGRYCWWKELVEIIGIPLDIFDDPSVAP